MRTIFILTLILIFTSCLKKESSKSKSISVDPYTETFAVRDIQAYDSPIPDQDVVNASFDYIPGTNSISVHDYTYSIGTSEGKDDIVEWTSTPIPGFQALGLNLEDRRKYYANFKWFYQGKLSGTSSKSFQSALKEVFNWNLTVINQAPTLTNRTGHSTVWTGEEMIVWGGVIANSTNTGFAYNSSTGAWRQISTVNAPSARSYHTATWTGTEMIIWGGDYNGVLLASGALYNPKTDSWRIMTTENAPTPRREHRAVWADTSMIIWGGHPATTGGAKFNPEANSWTGFEVSNFTARRYHSQVWTGTHLILWGGRDATATALDSGIVLDKNMTKVRTFTFQARTGHSTVWTGKEMIVFGGTDKNFKPYTYGAAYHFDANAFDGINTRNSPTPRTNHSAVWNGSEMIIFGGNPDRDITNVIPRDISAYNFETQTWRKIAEVSESDTRSFASLVWTGSDILVWGGDNRIASNLKLSITNTTAVCGGVTNLSEFCYGDNLDGQYARILGVAYTTFGEQIVYAMNVNGVKVWKDPYSDKVLDPLGNSYWFKDEKEIAPKVFNLIKDRKCEVIGGWLTCKYIF